jgi:magnesium transporter
MEAPFVTVWRKRAFWLSCLFGAELFTFTALSHFEDEIGRLVVLSLFVPLCISTGGNSGSQAATLITRAMALGQLTVSNWAKVLRHELAIGLVLGLTLGVIAFLRGAATPADIRAGEREQEQAFSVRVGPTVDLTPTAEGTVLLPEGAEMVLDAKDFRHVHLPPGEKPTLERDGESREYRFPAHTKLRQDPVDRWALAEVISLAVMGICLWGTIVGSMLPLVFKRLGVDPGIASSPFVATFVDVTGIIIYFTIAKAFLL